MNKSISDYEILANLYVMNRYAKERIEELRKELFLLENLPRFIALVERGISAERENPTR